MPSTLSLPPQRQDCLDKLNQALDLALHTAEAASSEGNHRVVLQAVREVTRIITLMNKMAFNFRSGAKTKTKPVPKPAHPKTLETFLRPDELPEQDELSLDLLQKISLNLAELQAFQADAESGLPCTANGKGEKVGNYREKKGLIKIFFKNNQPDNQREKNNPHSAHHRRWHRNCTSGISGTRQVPSAGRMSR